MSPKISSSQKERRRRQILDAAKRVFSEKGYGAVTLKDIVEETGMSRGWIYLYFQTKEEIFSAILDRQDIEYERYEDLLDAAPCIWDVITNLYVQQFKALLASPNGSLMPAFYEYFLTDWRDETRKEFMLQRYEKGISQFAKLLQIGVDRGEFTPVISVFDISRLAASFQDGIMIHTIAVGPDNANTERQVEALMQYLYRLLNP